MAGQDWIVTPTGDCHPLESVPYATSGQQPYRLYRFLTDLEDILSTWSDDAERLRRICPILRRLLDQSPWLHSTFLPPDPKLGWSVMMLYDEPDFPLTLQTVVWDPGSLSPIHNHGTWGVVAILSGQERNTFWRRTPTPDQADAITQAGEQRLVPGDILALLPEAIHQVRVEGDQPTLSVNLYGQTDFSRRWQFDPDHSTAQLF
ncbi:MAG: hypothetical protein OHK0012_05250 [Synechococcales cyanobacterium]